VWIRDPTVIVAVRVNVLVDATEYSMVPLVPVPVAPEVIVNHDALEIAFHEHEALLVAIVRLPLPPEAPKVAVAGSSAVTVHGCPAWVTVWTRSPAVIRPVRVVEPTFSATAYSIDPPVPVPVAPEVIVSHGTFEVADQLHVAPLVETVVLPDPPDAEKVAVPGLSDVTVHGATPSS